MNWNETKYEIIQKYSVLIDKLLETLRSADKTDKEKLIIINEKLTVIIEDVGVLIARKTI